MPQTISFDDISQHLVSITDFRRNAGRYLNQLSQGRSFVIVRDSVPIGTLIPTQNKSTKTTRQADIDTIRRLSGGFHFPKSLSPDQLNKEYDKMYDEMLPR